MRDQRVSLPAALAELHQHRLGLLAHQRPPAREVHQRLRLAGRRQQLPAAHDLGQRGAQQRLGGREAEHAHGRVVGVDERAVGALRGDRVGDALEDRAQVVGHEPLAELGGAQLGDVLAGHERHRRAVRGLHGLGAHAQRARAARRVAGDRGAAEALAARGAHGRQLLLGERPAVGVAAAVGRQPGGGGAADGVLARQLARRAVGGQHAAAPGLDDDDRRREPVEELGTAVAGADSPLTRRSLDPDAARARRGLPPRTRAGSPRTGGGGPPRRGGWR